MTRHKAGSWIAGAAAIGYIGTAALHSTGYESVVRLADAGPETLRALAPPLWISFAIDLAAVGLIVGVVAVRPGGAGRLILSISALVPIGAAILQMIFLGFIPPTALLLTIGVLALTAAVILPGPPARRGNP